MTIDELVAKLTEEVLRLSLMVGHLRLQLGMIDKDTLRQDVTAVAENFGIEPEWST